MNKRSGLVNDRGCLAIDDGVISTCSISCCYLRCAADVIARTKSNDCVRVYHIDAGDSHQSAPLLPTTAKLSSTTIAGEAAQNTPTTDSLLHGDNRLQRRKEKKRRKKEIRMRAIEEDTPMIQSMRVTSTTFHHLSSSPTQNIFTQSMSTSVSLSTPHPRSIVHVKPLIILDLNGILCHRIRRTNNATAASNSSIFRPSCGNISNTDVIPRSDLHEFLTLLHENFCLAVWTSATRKTAKLLVQALFPEEVRERLLFTWHRNFCCLVKSCGSDSVSGGDGASAHHNRRTTSNDAIHILHESLPITEGLMASRLNAHNNRSFGEAENIQEATDSHESRSTPTNDHDNLTAIKSLSKVWSAYPLWDETNTILLDDSPEKCPDQFRGNALHPRAISGTVTACVNENRNHESDGGTKIAVDDPKLGDDSYHIIDDDEANQKMQRNFFQLLANYWEQSASPPTQNLIEFLEEHADSYNMRRKIPYGL